MGAIESYLADNVATLLNTEISLSYLNSLKAATVFISSTYFYVRLLCKFKFSRGKSHAYAYRTTRL